MMKLLLFSTQRQIRNWLSEFDNTILDKHKSIGEFFSDIILVKDKIFVDSEIRKIYLFEAIKNLDISKLGFKKEFLSFFKDSDFIFSFLKEIFIEKVALDNVIMADTYIEYEEHLLLINQLKENYKNLLEENGYIDLFLVEEFDINSKLLDGIDEIELFLDGYLSKWEIDILDKIERKITININISRFNRSLIRKILLDLDEGYSYKIDFKSREILKKEILSTNTDVEVSYFSKKFDEINFIFAKIAEFVESGMNPDKIAVILPDESFSEFLEEFDEFHNLNFAMGKSFRHSNLYIKLKAIYEYLTNEDEISRLKSQDWLEEFQELELLEFIRLKASNKELKVIDEELFKLKQFVSFFKDKKQFLHFVLQKFESLGFDDVYSGKITVMGVLESRGMQYDGVILVNFNDNVVPNVNNKDLFLNTAIRKKANLPTRQDKENLQKHYYYSLIHSSKKVAISYVQNNSENVSRFIYELGLDIGENMDEKYKEVLYKFSSKKQIPFYDEKLDIKQPLTPTTLKTLLECPKRYYLSKNLAIFNENDDEDNFGSVFHNASEKVVKDKDNINSSKEYFEIVMSEIFQTLNTKKDIYEIRVKYEDKIKEFCNQDFENMKYSQNMIEEWLDNYEYNRVKLLCKVDRIDITSTTITLIDYKTGNIDKLLKHPYEFQLTFYYLWAKNRFPDKIIKVGYWDILNSEFVEDEPKTDELGEILLNLPTISYMANDIIVDDKVVKKMQDICKYCDYNIMCGRD